MLNLSYGKMLTKFYIVNCLFSYAVSGNNGALSNCACGPKLYYLPKIIGAMEADAHEFPWQAAIYHSDEFFCSGSVINNLYVLTAAHCFNRYRIKNDRLKSVNIANLKVSIRILERVELSKSRDVRKIVQVIIHENFVCANFTNDIALIKMEKPITEYTSTIHPICLPKSNKKYEYATVSGWGKERADGTNVKKLRKAKVRVLSDYLCYVRSSIVYSQDLMLCADSFKRQPCHGDSGGPLMIINEFDKYELIGIVSNGKGCLASFFPHIYTRVRHYLQWIKNHTSDATYCKD
ncbi:UNVERIFIED_CONTAM: hypothetical protein RMT77_003295 [Armadillidium vulgare]